MHSRASLFCPVDNTTHLFNNHQTSKAMTIITIIPTMVGQVIIATKFSLQAEFGVPILPNSDFNRPSISYHIEHRQYHEPPLVHVCKEMERIIRLNHSLIVFSGWLHLEAIPQNIFYTTTSAVHAWGRPQFTSTDDKCTASPRPSLIHHSHSNVISSSSSHSLSPSSSLRLGSIPASLECLAGVRFTSLSLRKLTSDTEAPVSTRVFTFLSPSNTLQVKSGASFSKRYNCAFLLPVCSLPSSRFLDNRVVGVATHFSPLFELGLFRSVWFIFLLRGQVRLRSPAPPQRQRLCSLQLAKKCLNTPHVQHLRSLTYTGATLSLTFSRVVQRRFPDPFPSQ
ncbi:unnamed protein product [Acanthosepion pharaonis]|uniref:Uncharacterized protein n=1 Tax=Acanthosepion pharaonis TaxID=158019 RepID=A0A812B4A7_ACAPH|nr:unnamed protein product [Sepia pharaonis]